MTREPSLAFAQVKRYKFVELRESNQNGRRFARYEAIPSYGIPCQPDPATMRAIRARLLHAADQDGEASADQLARLRQAVATWPGGSGDAMREWVEHATEQDRLILARMRNIAHHIPRGDAVETEPDGNETA